MKKNYKITVGLCNELVNRANDKYITFHYKDVEKDEVSRILADDVRRVRDALSYNMDFIVKVEVEESLTDWIILDLENGD